MKTVYLQDGQIITDVDKPVAGLFNLNKFIKRELDYLNVPKFNLCCDATNTTFPVRYNSTTGGLERINTSGAWVAADDTLALQTALTALASGGQTGATSLKAGYNEFIVVATAGDSSKLPDSPAGTVVTVKNDGVASMDVFPFLSDTIDDGTVNVAYKVPVGETVQFTKIDAVNWEADNQVIVSGDGSASTPALSFTTQPNMGLYKVSSTQLGTSVGGTLVGGFNASGLFTNSITEQTTGSGITIAKARIQKTTATTKSGAATLTGTEVSTGLLTYTGGAASITLPTATALATALGAVQGTTFDWIVDNSGGSGTVTIVVGSGITAISTVTGGTTLTLAQSATAGVAGFKFSFISATVAIISRLY